MVASGHEEAHAAQRDMGYFGAEELTTSPAGELTQDVVAPSVGQPISYVVPCQVVEQPGALMPQIEAPSVADASPKRVRSRNVPYLSTMGF